MKRNVLELCNPADITCFIGFILEYEMNHEQSLWDAPAIADFLRHV